MPSVRQGRWSNLNSNGLAQLESLIILERNRQYAEREGVTHWQHAVLISTLEACGLTESDLRWLLAQGYIEHAIEITTTGDKERRFRKPKRDSFDRRICFVLTEVGASFVHQGVRSPGTQSSLASPLPQWDAGRRELRVGKTVVKRFRVPARNQTTILAAFQEEGWPERIDDPLPRVRDRDSQVRLHDALKKLNQGHLMSLLTFHGDGTGKGIRWRIR